MRLGRGTSNDIGSVELSNFWPWPPRPVLSADELDGTDWMQDLDGDDEGCPDSDDEYMDVPLDWEREEALDEMTLGRDWECP